MTEAVGTKESSKTKAFISSTRQQAGYTTSTQNKRLSPAGTHTTKKPRCLWNWSHLFYLISFLKWTIFLTPTPPLTSMQFFGEYVCHEPTFLWSVCSHSSARATTKQMLLQGPKKSDQGWGGGLTSLNSSKALLLVSVDFIFTALPNRGTLLKVVFPIIQPRTSLSWMWFKATTQNECQYRHSAFPNDNWNYSSERLLSPSISQSAQVPQQLGNAAKENKAGSQHSSSLAEKKTSCKSAWQIIAGKAKGKPL